MYIFFMQFIRKFQLFCFPRAVRAEPLLGFEMNNKYFVSNSYAPPLSPIPWK